MDVVENNLRRRADAEAQRNSYFAKIAAMQDQFAQEEYNRQMAEQVRRDRLAHAEAERRQQAYQFGAQERRLGRAGDEAHLERMTQLQATNEERERQRNAATNAADFMSGDVARVGSSLDKAQAEFEKAQASYDTAISELETGASGLVQYDPRAKRFTATVPAGLKGDERTKAMKDAVSKVAEANAKLEKIAADFNLASQLYTTHQSSLDNLHKTASNWGLQIGKRDDRWTVYDPTTKKSFQARNYFGTTAPKPANTPQISPAVANIVQWAERGTQENNLVDLIRSANPPIRPTAEEIQYLRDIGISETVLDAFGEPRRSSSVTAPATSTATAGPGVKRYVWDRARGVAVPAQQ